MESNEVFTEKSIKDLILRDASGQKWFKWKEVVLNEEKRGENTDLC